MLVRVSKNQLDRFRRKARDSEKEIFAYLVGTIDSTERISISYFAYPELESSSPCHVRPDYESSKEIQTEAEEKHLEIVGDIHSHPNTLYGPVMSGTDHSSHVLEGNRISGVVSIFQRRTKFCFWTAHSSKPCALTYFKKISE
jgi:proteasome lid subunit RPN8/RPN11